MIIAGTKSVSDENCYTMLSFKRRNNNAVSLKDGEVPPVISNKTYTLHGFINCGESACEGYKLKLSGSGMTASVMPLGQYLFENMPIGHNIIEVYDDNNNYIDMFEIIFNDEYADFVDNKNNRVYIDLNGTQNALVFTDKYQVSFGIDDMGKIHFDETGPCHDVIGDIEFVSLDQTVNLYGQIVNETADPLAEIKTEIENTDISCITGVEGDFLLPDVPIKEQRLNFYDAGGEYISGVDLLFNIDGGDICLNSLNMIIVDVGNSDGKIFKNMQIGFEINLDNKSLGYKHNEIHGNVETPENRTRYSIICILFALSFFFVMIKIDRKHPNGLGNIEK